MKQNNPPVSKSAVLAIIALSSFITAFMDSSINIAVPSIGRQFSLNAISLSWVSTSYLLAAAVFLVPFGRLADIKGRKKIFVFGTMVFTVSSFLAAISTSALLLISCRILQGIGSAMIFATALAILTSVFSPKERGLVLGMNIAAVYFGLSLGPFIGGLLTQDFGWGSIFLVDVILGLIIVILTFWKLKGEWAEARGEEFDFIGSLIYGFTLTFIIYGLSVLPARWAAWLILAGVLGILAFVKWEMRVTAPILKISLFRNNAAFTFSNLAALINYSATFAVGFLLSLYLQQIKGLSPKNAGLILISNHIVMAILSPFTGRLSDRIEPRIVASIGMTLTFGGLLPFVFLTEETTLQFIVASLIILGTGFGFFSSPNINAIMSSVETRFYGVASATQGTMRLVGHILSMGIVMLVFALYIGRVQITPEYYPLFLKSVRVVFAISAALCFGGIFASLARGKVR